MQSRRFDKGSDPTFNRRHLVIVDDIRGITREVNNAIEEINGLIEKHAMAPELCADLRATQMRLIYHVEAMQMLRVHDETDQGYTNHETLTIHLDIHNNSLEKQEAHANMARLRMRTINPDHLEKVVATDLQEYYEGDLPAIQRSLTKKHQVYTDLTAAALVRVNWHELAKELIDHVKEQDA